MFTFLSTIFDKQTVTKQCGVTSTMDKHDVRTYLIGSVIGYPISFSTSEFSKVSDKCVDSNWAVFNSNNGKLISRNG